MRTDVSRRTRHRSLLNPRFLLRFAERFARNMPLSLLLFLLLCQIFLQVQLAEFLEFVGKQTQQAGYMRLWRGGHRQIYTTRYEMLTQDDCSWHSGESSRAVRVARDDDGEVEWRNERNRMLRDPLLDVDLGMLLKTSIRRVCDGEKEF